ncbi:hypothetical protein ACHAXA_000704 [Cyclostephanos tholiformis]|uniref:Fe2OG dioxygenase domain-containing protein n=1 Tax=Cyclostephanos tholiformis TaxID=382380 RepID=A0ABD3R858_9STRA
MAQSTMLLLRILLLIRVASMASTTGTTDATGVTSAAKNDANSIVDLDAVVVGSCDDGGGTDSPDGECVVVAAGGGDGNAAPKTIVDDVDDDDDDDDDKSKTAPRRRGERNSPVDISIRNDSDHRIDVHYDDGRFGNVVGTADANGGIVRISSFETHRFFITMHGVREGLVDPETDEQHSFVVRHRHRGWGGGGNGGEEDFEGEDHDKHNEQLFVVPANASPSKNKCKDRYPVCVQEAERGECTRNPGWMIVNCCRSCDDREGYGYLIDSDVRCAPDRLNATTPAWHAGDLDDLFARWATDERYKIYGPRAISSPGGVHDAEHDGPWIFAFDDFVNDDEIEQILRGAAYGHGYQRSTDQGQIVGASGEAVKVTSSTRTSSNAWCGKRCEDLPGVMSVTARIEEVTGIPQNHYESFQILRYEEGQFYRRHHDSSEHKKNDSTGHRILTFFLYLNDVENGGETRFTTLDIDVKPKKGRALVWSSVMNDDPNRSDARMYHEAKEVLKGIKYAANHWIHQFDFRNANLWGWQV